MVFAKILLAAAIAFGKAFSIAWLPALPPGDQPDTPLPSARLSALLSHQVHLPHVQRPLTIDQSADIFRFDCLPGESGSIQWYFDHAPGETTYMQTVWEFIVVETAEPVFHWRPYTIIGPGVLEEIVTVDDEHFLSAVGWVTSNADAQVISGFCF